MNIRTVLLLIGTLVTITINGQKATNFTPYGRPVFLTFSNVHTSFNENKSNTAFEITRLFLGYEHFFSEKLSARANFDIADPGVGGLQMTAYVKNAFLQYKTTNFSGRIGMISTEAFNLVEKQWGYRYIAKTFQDEYGINPSADLGAAIEYSPSKVISFDASVLNGEGYKKLQSDSTLKYTGAITLRPAKGLILRAYMDFMKKNTLQRTLSLFAGYSVKAFRTGFEYTSQKNNKMVTDHDLTGISAYLAAGFAKKFTAFVRYDDLWSSKTPGSADTWNFNKDGQLILGGVDFSPVSGIRIAPVWYGWRPSDSAKPFTSTIGFYFEYKL